MTASSVSPPLLTTLIAFAQASTPFALAMIIFFGRDWDFATRMNGKTAAPTTAARRVNEFSTRVLLSSRSLQGAGYAKGFIIPRQKTTLPGERAESSR